MPENNTIALCIPAYNAAGYLPRLLLSAQNQHIPFDEIYVYNDCSTDKTKEVAEKFGAIVINGEINKGCSAGKNALASITSCDWIHFHDADDELYPNYTSLAHAWISRENCPDVVLFDYEYRVQGTNTLLAVRRFNNQQLEEDPIKYSIQEQINPFCGLYRKSAYLRVGGYEIDPAILYNEDSAFHIKLALNGLTFSSENELSIVNYKMSESMSSSNKENCILAQFEVIKRAVQSLEEHGILSNYRTSISDRLWNCATQLSSIGRWKFVDECIDIVTKLDPGSSTRKSNMVFNILCLINTKLAYRLREYLVRTLKPELR